VEDNDKLPFPWGFLAVPDGPNSSADAARRRALNESVGIAVMYLPVSLAGFHQVVTDGTLRQTIASTR
jgi:hypothetical protein